MTFIGLATYDDRIEVVTDTMAYTQMLDDTTTTSKHLCLPHLDAVILGQGASGFTSRVKFFALYAPVPSFDELLDDGTEICRNAWENASAELEETEGPPPGDSVALFAGWSDAAQSFVAYMYASEQDFKKVQVKKPFILPGVTDYRPSGLEARRNKRALAYNAEYVELIDFWLKRPQMAPPASTEEWVQIAAKARTQQAFTEWAPIIIAGDLIHTRVVRGGHLTRNVHTFDDSDQSAEFRSMVRWTNHPLALPETCYCPSGKTWGDCKDTSEHEAWEQADEAKARTA